MKPGDAVADAEPVDAPAELRREARIDLAAIEHNVARLREVAGTRSLMAVVKANGYGHGSVPVARAALRGGADWLGVVDIVEALELRDAGIDAPLLTWIHATDADFASAVAARIDIGVNSLDQLRAVAQAVRGDSRADVHVKVDTGLGRNGAAAENWGELFAVAADLESAGRIRVRGIFSHLANAGDDEDAAQIAAFQRALAAAADAGVHPELRHLASTAAALRVPASRFDMVRVGIGIYGLSPFDDATSAELGLVPALTLVGGVVAVKRVPAGTGVSYGYSYRTRQETTLALVSLGYADGIPRLASNRAPVSIRGGRYTVSGRIAMDQFVVDLGADECEVGDDVVLFGDPATGVPSADEWAAAAETINYEVVTRLGGRIVRRYPS
ncbi:alanine racemase [Planctomonas psychrotolerans]|uniref:alanine racemase n=1 Tax=Planctomonas psychrotolerans TaxID=2528712 RepID=UPI001D0D5967|nr:alanine racemase [Planctomonas psychrotolerans]